MPRKLRIQFPGAMYHLMSRGDRRERIFLDDVDRQDFIKPLAEACQKTGWQVHAYCLMPNHYHVVLTGNLGEHHAGELHEEVAKAKAEGIVAEELNRRGWGEEELARRSKSDADKLEIAARLRRETT